MASIVGAVGAGSSSGSGSSSLIGINVKDFGVVGNGSTDDSTALKAAEAALTAGQALYFPPNCRVRFAQASPVGGAAIRLNGLSNVGVIMAPGAELIMDNLSAGAGTSHGIYVTGACSNVVLDGCRVRWATAPSSRSNGEGFRLLGYPSDSAPAAGWTTTTGTISNIQLLNCTTINAPQTGAIFLGCSDVRVQNFRCENTRADGLHFNACRRVSVNGHQAVWTNNSIGDDGLAFVTYQHDTAVWQNSTNGPFNQVSLGQWSNSNSSVNGVVVQGGLANGCRISGSLDVSINSVVVTGKNNSGLIIDSAIADGVSFNWSYHASRGVSVSDLTVQDTPIGIYVPTQNVDSADNPAFWTFDARVTGATLRGATNWSIRTEGDGSAAGVQSGLHLSTIRAIPAASSAGGKGGIAFSGLRNSRIDDIVLDTSTGAQLAFFGQETVLSGALSTLARNNLSIGTVHCIGGKILFQDINGVAVQLARSTSSLTDGVQFVRATNVDAGALSVYLANRGNTGTIRGLHFQKVRNVRVDRATVEHDANTTTVWRSMELGGGDATDVAAENLRVASLIYTNTLNQVGSDITVQTGSFAPTNYQYAAAWRNGGEASPTWRTQQIDGPFGGAVGGGIAADFQTFTASGTWTKPAGATRVTVQLLGGGGGGGSGARRASGTQTSGGAGGGGGGFTVINLPASTLGATESVTVGAGGGGGAAVTANDTNGNAGTAGGASTFGSPRRAIAGGGAGGSAGANATANSGGGGSSATSTGGNGASGTIAAAGATGSTGNQGGGGGGSGGGVSATPASFAGGTGGGAPQSQLSGGTAGAIDGAGGAGANGPTGLAISGAGGGGGGSSTSGAGGAGGDGGTYGGAGGGGGSSLNGSNSGAGGAGAAGFVVVISE